MLGNLTSQGIRAMSKAGRVRSVVTDGKPDEEVRLVLRRCALFYRASGFTEDLLAKEWSKALQWAGRQKVKAKIYRAGPVEQFRFICERWIRDPKYMNGVGNPLALAAKGKVSIQSIMDETDISGDPNDMAASLEKIGSVRRVARNKYLLIKKMFRTRPTSYVAYETYSQFLAHAVKAATMPLQNVKSDKYSHWLTSTRTGLSQAEIGTFIQFVKRRSQPQMLEIDDALNSPRKRKQPLKRPPRNTVGAGIFTFVTEPNSP
jgi:hypothetical protein